MLPASEAGDFVELIALYGEAMISSVHLLSVIVVSLVIIALEECEA
jgi:hypothetical protein